MAMSVRKMSGEEVAGLDAAELAALVESYGDSVLGLKRYLRHRLGVPRFRLQLTAQGESEPLFEDRKLTSYRARAELSVVILNWALPTQEELAHLRTASLEGAAAELEGLLKRPMNPDVVVDRMERPALWVASARGHLDNARLLIEAMANVNKADRKGMAPLWIASYWGHSSIVELLLEARCEVDNTDTRGGSSPLWVSCRNCCEGVVKLLVQASAGLDKTNIDRQSPVWIAAATGHPAILRLLLRARADLAIPDRVGRSALWIAVANSHLDPQPLDVLKAEVNAVEGVRVSVVRTLLEARADIDCDDEGESVLSVAAKLGNAQIMQLLLEATPSDSGVAAHCLSQPAWKASTEGHDDIVQMLLKAGADKNWANSQGETLLWSAAKKGFTRVAQVLLQAGADHDLASANGQSPLCLAAARGFVSIVRLLLASKADKEQSTRDKQSPLWLAAANANVAVVRSLLQARANINEADLKGDSPLAVASAKGHVQVARMLQEAVSEGVDTVGSPPRGPKRPRVPTDPVCSEIEKGPVNPQGPCSHVVYRLALK
ncbi:Ank3 [Symbiodinium sp. CCMP2592]|nr:Ank3 [Symbiodinium sp. CCMP2592]